MAIRSQSKAAAINVRDVLAGRGHVLDAYDTIAVLEAIDNALDVPEQRHVDPWTPDYDHDEPPF